MSGMDVAWDQASAAYLANYGFDDAIVNYGPWAPDEATLNLLGNVQGLHVLDAGCGGGHNSVALARAGATVTGLDSSATQVEAARARARAAGQTVRFLHDSLTRPLRDHDSRFDLILCNYVLHYVENIIAALRNCAAWLRPGGRLIAAMDHPIRVCFQDEMEDDLSVFPVRSYFDDAPVPLRLDGPAAPLPTVHRTVGAWTEEIARAGLVLERLLEPHPPPAMIDEYWPDDSALAPLRLLPQVLIIVAGKPAH